MLPPDAAIVARYSAAMCHRRSVFSNGTFFPTPYGFDMLPCASTRSQTRTGHQVAVLPSYSGQHRLAQTQFCGDSSCSPGPRYEGQCQTSRVAQVAEASRINTSNDKARNRSLVGGQGSSVLVDRDASVCKRDTGPVSRWLCSGQVLDLRWLDFHCKEGAVTLNKRSGGWADATDGCIKTGGCISLAVFVVLIDSVSRLSAIDAPVVENRDQAVEGRRAGDIAAVGLSFLEAVNVARVREQR